MNKDTIHDTEDRSFWYVHGEQLEKQFVEFCNANTELQAQINPTKLVDKTVPDLLMNGYLADLKSQNTPFFTADRYGIPAQYAVTFNRKDYERYSRLYPEIEIYFWIEWQQLEYRERKVKYMRGIYYAPFSYLKQLIEAGAPEHSYQRREREERSNALSSFVLDVRKLHAVYHYEA